MIGSLRGILLERSGDEVTVEVAGVGYRVTVNPDTAMALGEVGAEVFVHVHHHFREDDQTLYGFATASERRCFEALIGAHGVGPALGLAILATHAPDGLARVLAEEDIDALCMVPGVGKKTAARLLVELQSRLDLLDTPAGPVGRRNGDGSGTLGDVHEALVELGYGPDEIRVVLRELPIDGDSAVLLREALQRLAVGADR